VYDWQIVRLLASDPLRNYTETQFAAQHRAACAVAYAPADSTYVTCPLPVSRELPVWASAVRDHSDNMWKISHAGRHRQCKHPTVRAAPSCCCCCCCCSRCYFVTRRANRKPQRSTSTAVYTRRNESFTVDLIWVNKKFELMLTRRAKAYSSSGSVV